MSEYEIVEYQAIEGLQIFFNTVSYRTSHFHAEWEILWLLDGSLSVCSKDGKQTIVPGDMVIFNPNDVHEFHKIEQEATFLCLQFSPEILPKNQKIVVDGLLLSNYGTKQQLEKIRTCLRGCAEAFYGKLRHGSFLCVGNVNRMMYELLTFMPHHSLTPHEISEIDFRNARLNRLVQYVDENFQHKIRLSDFAEREGYSLAHMSRFVKAAMNLSFQEYVTQVRFHYACQLISGGARRMLDVCYESGFSDYRYFSRTFREKYHMTPEEFSRSGEKDNLQISGVHHSLHSMERFYTPAESRALMARYFGQAEQTNKE